MNDLERFIKFLDDGNLMRDENEKKIEIVLDWRTIENIISDYKKLKEGCE